MMTDTQNKSKDRAARDAAKEAQFGRFDFVKMAPAAGILSGLVTVGFLILIMIKGFNYGIDFAGGTEIQLKFQNEVKVADMRTALADAGVGNPLVQEFGDANEFLIRLETPRAATERETNQLITQNVNRIRTIMTERFGLGPEGVLRVDTVGPAVGSELKRNGLLATFYSFLVILIYIALRFDYKYAPGAVICLVHDTIVTVGIFSLLGREVNIQIMAAILTLIGYSLNDTIVTFDRIRETEPQFRERSGRFVINRAINDMLGRTVLTAATTLVAVTTLYVFGGGVIADISFTLIIGVIVGTYSSIYVAAPLVLVMDKYQKRSSAPTTSQATVTSA
jgi:preprotein translocase subunit SecF